MDRQDFMPAVMSPAGTDLFSPVQVQKLFFLLDENVAEHWFGKLFFDFKPHHYGPFDKEVYWELEKLEQEGEASILHPLSIGPRKYRLTDRGVERGKPVLNTFEPVVQKYICDLVSFIRRVSFTELVSAVYEKYPEMRANSVFAQPES